MDDDELAAFFQRNGGGAGDEVVADAVGRRGQRVARTGDDDHATVQERAAGELGADVVVVVQGNGVLLGAGQRVEIDVFHSQLIAQQPPAPGGDDQVHIDARGDEA